MLCQQASSTKNGHTGKLTQSEQHCEDGASKRLEARLASIGHLSSGDSYYRYRSPQATTSAKKSLEFSVQEKSEARGSAPGLIGYYEEKIESRWVRDQSTAEQKSIFAVWKWCLNLLPLANKNHLGRLVDLRVPGNKISRK